MTKKTKKQKTAAVREKRITQKKQAENRKSIFDMVKSFARWTIVPSDATTKQLEAVAQELTGRVIQDLFADKVFVIIHKTNKETGVSSMAVKINTIFSGDAPHALKEGIAPKPETDIEVK
jgi:hypothetical protein